MLGQLTSVYTVTTNYKDAVAELIERGFSGTEVREVESHSGGFSFEILCRFVGKIPSVCGKDHIVLWEKFGEQS